MKPIASIPIFIPKTFFYNSVFANYLIVHYGSKTYATVTNVYLPDTYNEKFVRVLSKSSSIRIRYKEITLIDVKLSSRTDSSTIEESIKKQSSSRSICLLYINQAIRFIHHARIRATLILRISKQFLRTASRNLSINPNLYSDANATVHKFARRIQRLISKLTIAIKLSSQLSIILAFVIQMNWKILQRRIAFTESRLIASELSSFRSSWAICIVGTMVTAARRQGNSVERRAGRRLRSRKKRTALAVFSFSARRDFHSTQQMNGPGTR